MHRVAVAAVVEASPGSIPSTIVQFELCIGQYVVHPLNHDDLQLSPVALSMPARCIPNLRSFVCHRIDEIKTTMGKFVTSALVFLASALSRPRPANSLLVFRSNNNVSKIAPRTKGRNRAGLLETADLMA